MTARHARLVATAAILLLLGSCSKQTVDRICEPGSTQECLCRPNVQGVQVCAKDGKSWGKCGGCDETRSIRDRTQRPHEETAKPSPRRAPPAGKDATRGTAPQARRTEEAKRPSGPDCVELFRKLDAKIGGRQDAERMYIACQRKRKLARKCEALLKSAIRNVDERIDVGDYLAGSADKADLEQKGGKLRELLQKLKTVSCSDATLAAAEKALTSAHQQARTALDAARMYKECAGQLSDQPGGKLKLGANMDGPYAELELDVGPILKRLARAALADTASPCIALGLVAGR